MSSNSVNELRKVGTLVQLTGVA